MLSCFHLISRIICLFRSVLSPLSLLILQRPNGNFFFPHLEVSFILAYFSSSSNFNILCYIFSMLMSLTYLSPNLFDLFLCGDVISADFFAPLTDKQSDRCVLTKLSYIVNFFIFVLSILLYLHIKQFPLPIFLSTYIFYL